MMIYVDVACRALLATVFVVAITAKVSTGRAFAQFVESLADLEFVPAPRVVAVAVVTAEALSASLLLVPGLPVAGVLLVSVLLVAFLIGIRRAVRRPRPVRCSCFGAKGAVLGTTHAVRNMVLLGVAGIGLVADLTSAGDALGWQVAVAAAGGLLTGAMLTRWDDLDFLFAGG